MGNFFSIQEHSGAHENFSGGGRNGPVTQQIVYDHTVSQRFRRETDDYRRQVDDLVRENQALKRYNQALRTEVHQLNQKMDAVLQAQREQHERQPIKASVSTDHIKQYVDEMLKNSDINIYGFPDAIEKQIYRNIFNMLLNVLDHTLDTSEIKLFGHKIIFDIQPISPNNDNEIVATASAELPHE
jgi:regulator of replication initiation timing